MTDLIIVGASGLGKEVAWLAERAGVTVAGFLDDDFELQGCEFYHKPVLGVIDEWYKHSHYQFVIAMAMGRAIITTDAPGCRETVVDGDNGFLVLVKSVDELVEAMQRFIDKPELVTQMGGRSRQVAENKYDVHKVNQMMLSAMGINPKC